MGDENAVATLGYSDKLLARRSEPGTQFTEKTTRHHKPLYDDYTVAKMHIMQAIGDITDLDLFGRQCLVAVFVKPGITRTGIKLPMMDQKNDWWEHKVVLLLKTGPDAFKGTPGYIASMYGGTVVQQEDPEDPSKMIDVLTEDFRPKLGEWLFANANAGIQTSIMGDGASRPQGVDHRGDPEDLFEWDGWPCRIIQDDQFLGRLPKPHQVV